MVSIGPFNDIVIAVPKQKLYYICFVDRFSLGIETIHMGNNTQLHTMAFHRCR